MPGFFPLMFIRNLYALYECKCCGQYFVGHPKLYRLHYSLKRGWREKYLNTRGSYTDVSEIRLGGATGRLLPEGLDRNEVEFGRADLRSFIFAVFRMSYKLHAGVCGRKTQKRTLSPTYTYAQLVRLSAKQQRHRKSAHPNSLTFLSKPFWKQPPRCPAQPNFGNCVLETEG